MEIINWKEVALTALTEEDAKKAAQEAVRLADRKVKARATFAKYLKNCGVPFEEDKIEFEVMPDNMLRTFIVVDDVEFTTRKDQFEYSGCGVVQVCPHCEQRITSYTVSNPAQLGAQLRGKSMAYHVCQKEENAQIEQPQPTVEQKLLDALTKFIAERSYQGQ